MQRQLDGVVRNKLIDQRIATAHNEYGYTIVRGSIVAEDEKPSTEIQIGYKHA